MAGNLPSGWRKIFIVGGPGSGKTTLGSVVARAIDAPLFELDTVGYESGVGAERPMADRLRDVAAIASQERWVAEGSYIDWTRALAEAADGIVWLDPPWRVARHRIVARHVKASLRRSNRHPGLRKLWRFLGHCKGFYTGPDARRLRVARWVDGGFADKTVICRTDREVEDLVRDIRSRGQGG
jgi:chloramphenicol 3-O-phosphotransferase